MVVVPFSLGYATVRDFCDSAERLPKLMLSNSDLKDVQRPWAFKAVTARAKPNACLLEIGGGVPLCSAALADAGYRVTIVDPYEGAGNGPTEFGNFRRRYRKIEFVRELFSETIRAIKPGSIDCIFSISTLEHIHDQGPIFRGLQRFLRPGGWSIHCIDSVVEGRDELFHRKLVSEILAKQRSLAGLPADPDEYGRLVEKLRADRETYYLSAQGFHQWRGGLAYDAYPFQRVVSIETCVQCAA